MNTSSQGDISKPSFIVTAGAWITGVSLILLGFLCLVFNGIAEGYGVFPVDEKGTGYLVATGMRDVSLGMVTLYLLLRFRAAMPVYLCMLSFIPFADALIVLKYGSPGLSLGVHVVGFVGLIVMAVCAFGEQKNAA